MIDLPLLPKIPSFFRGPSDELGSSQSQAGKLRGSFQEPGSLQQASLYQDPPCTLKEG